jgi:hypothetical protein
VEGVDLGRGDDGLGRVERRVEGGGGGGLGRGGGRGFGKGGKGEEKEEEFVFHDGYFRGRDHFTLIWSGALIGWRMIASS